MACPFGVVAVIVFVIVVVAVVVVVVVVVVFVVVFYVFIWWYLLFMSICKLNKMPCTPNPPQRANSMCQSHYDLSGFAARSFSLFF